MLENFKRKKNLDLRNKDGLYLPAGFALKSQGSPCARLVLDPSGNLNGALLKAPNLEEKTSSVLRRIQGMPVLLSADIHEASTHLSLFLIDYDHKTQQLTAQATEHSKLVTI